MSHKLSVYCICKNEQRYLTSFLNLMLSQLQPQDELIIVDTGSTDTSWDTLCKYKEKDSRLVIYQKEFIPWRFDTARNYAQSKIDINNCTLALSIDIDEIFEDSNWRNDLDDILNTHSDIDQIFHEFIYDFFDVVTENQNPYEEYINKTCYTKPALIQKVGKFHNPRCFHWKYPIHEILEENENTTPNIVTTKKLKLIHLQTRKKETRNSYFKMLEDAVKENPSDTRMQFLYAREFMNMGKEHYDRAIQEFKKYLVLSEQECMDESEYDFSGSKRDRGEACCYIANMLEHGGKSQEEVMNQYIYWRMRSLGESPFSRESWFYAGIAFYRMGRKNLAREAFMMCKTFDFDTSFECDGLVWDDEHLNKYLLSTV